MAEPSLEYRIADLQMQLQFHRLLLSHFLYQNKGSVKVDPAYLDRMFSGKYFIQTAVDPATMVATFTLIKREDMEKKLEL